MATRTTALFVTAKKPIACEFCVLQEMAMYSTGSGGALPGGQLTMGIIGCLPDNVQQVIHKYP
jgi:hypothetical protein